MDVVTAARALTGDTLAFHILFACFGVGLPVMISIFELLAIIKKNHTYAKLVRTWTRILVILFVAGAVSGMIVSFSFSILWPTFLAFAGKVVGVGFGLEGYFFIIETIFLIVYVMSFGKFKPIYHWLIGLMLVISSSGSAFFITSINAWMNNPTGFKLNSSGQPINIDPWRAIFNKAIPTEFWHSELAYIFATAMVLLACYAWPLLKAKKYKLTDSAKNQILKVVWALAVVALVFGAAVGLSGDSSAKYIAKSEPYKLAAAEGIIHTQTHAPEIIGGIVKANSISGGVKIPGLLSFLTTGHTNGTVIGLDTYKVSQRPSLVTHYFFDSMVFIGIFTICFLILYLVVSWKKKQRPIESKTLFIGLIVCGFLGLAGIEFGWLLTEFGRQPYVIHGIMLVSQASTKSKLAVDMGEIFPIFYVILFVLTIYVLRKNIKLTKDF
ncbi:MAG TPA: cytochrome ubiquinol oxidase subunit I [Candidatus Saccharimonadales bacterium]|jgi:cytochrome d ubiquinol oxidase subunit I|nr:cytochrome ubiquinol oxidase subunit I [Candidatus Saccharimonadales bacterium]